MIVSFENSFIVILMYSYDTPIKFFWSEVKSIKSIRNWPEIAWRQVLLNKLWYGPVTCHHQRRRNRQKKMQRSLLLFGGRNVLYSSLTHYRFSTRMIWRKGLIYVEEWMLGRMDASEKWMIIWFPLHQATNLPKWMFFQKRFFKSSLLLNGLCGIQDVPQTAVTTFAFSSVCFLFYV